MTSVKRFSLAASIVLFVAATARAQTWQVGATAGIVNDVEKHVRLDQFGREDFNVFADVETDEHVLFRMTVGTLRVNGSNGGKVLSASPNPVLPDLPDRINYLTLGAAYEYVEGTFTSGLFAGFGGYRIEPESTSSSFENFRDPAQTVWGLHGGVDASLKVSQHLFFLARFTYHNIRSASGRSLVTANAGAGYRF